jgi:CBS domain-containing protein
MDAKKLRVKDLMQTDVKIVDKSTLIMEAAKMMREFGVSSLIVEPDEEGDAFGIVTRKDIVEAIVAEAPAGTMKQVEDIMTQPAITVNPGHSIFHCQKLMRMVGVRRLPVVEGADLIGILSNTDIFDKIFQATRDIRGD